MGSSTSGVNKPVLTNLPSNCSHNVQMYVNTTHINGSIEALAVDMMGEEFHDKEYNMTVNLGKHIAAEDQER